MKRNFQVNARMKAIMREHIAERLLELVEEAPGFPYDVDEKRSQDPRKIYFSQHGLDNHLVNVGTAYVGTRQVAGAAIPDNNGGYPIGDIFISFSNPKQGKGYTYDYADDVLGGFLPFHPTNTELSMVIDEAVDLWWKTL